MIKKMLHRVTVVWCLYGLVRLCIFVNPLLFRLMKLFMPVYEDNSAYQHIPDEPWNPADPEQILMVWFLVIVAIGIIVGISAAIHHFANWFFSTKKD